MPELTPTGAVDVVKRQVRRVRRRKNLYELQRTLYLMLAAGALAVTLVLPLALFAAPDVFGIAAWSTLAVLGGIGLFLTGAARRRWLARGAAIGWIETRAALGGRIRTLVELAARPTATPRFFDALLTAQIGRDLESWTPRRLLPRGVPRLALASALVTMAVLAVALRLAALAVPAAPSIGSAAGLDERSDEIAAATRGGERAVVAPGVPRQAGDRPSSIAEMDEGDDSPLTRLSSALQENVRQQVWGKAWERVREALARAGTRTGGNQQDVPTEYDQELAADDSGEWEIARAPSGELTRRRRAGIDRQPHAPEREADAADPAAEAPANAEHEQGGGGEGAAGAGNGTAPDLFGGPRVDTGPANGAFELSLAARMRADRGVGRHGRGIAPDADPDARPELAADQRRESPAHRMAVPAAYETVVREVFAHRRAETEQP